MTKDDLKKQSSEEMLQKMCNTLDDALKQEYKINQELHQKKNPGQDPNIDTPSL